MSIAATSISESPLGAIGGTPASTKKVPPNRQTLAVPDTTAAPEPR